MANLDFESTYEIKGEIGKGGGGTVYKAWHKRLQKDVVLKRIHSNLKDINARNEADILKRIKSEYLPQVIDFIENDNATYTVMEYVEGESFEDKLETGETFNEKDIIRFFRQLAKALNILHQQNPPIIHGDIKPANIMLTPKGDVCLIDFNVSSIFDGKYDQVTGYTPAYAAPEQIRFYKRALSAITTGGHTTHESVESDGEPEKTELMISAEDEEKTELLSTEPMQATVEKRNARRQALYDMQEGIDPRTDIYSLGATMYHIVSGKRPKSDGNTIEDIRKLSPHIMEPLAFIIMKCVAIDPKERYQTADELCAALENIYQSTDVYKKLIKRQQGIRIMLGAATVISAVVALVGLRMMRQERDTAYTSFVSKEQNARLEGDEAGVESAYTNAIRINQSRGDAYVEKGWFLYENGRYEEDIIFINELALPYIKDDNGRSNMYLLSGMCHYEMADMQTAKAELETAISEWPDNASAFQEEAVVLAKTGDVSGAEKCLETAVNLGLSDDALAYTTGEVFYAKGDYTVAEDSFFDAIRDTDDEYLKMRAYMMLADIYKESGRSYDERISLLKEAVSDIGKLYVYAAEQKLAQCYIDRFDEQGDREDAIAAINILKDVVNDGMGSFSTYQTMVLIYQNAKMYSEEEELLREMLDIYGEDYRIYMYFAYAQALRQNDMPNAERSYVQFKAYYDRAEEMYSVSNKSNSTDQTMENLRHIYADVVEGGWF